MNARALRRLRPESGIDDNADGRVAEPEGIADDSRGDGRRTRTPSDSFWRRRALIAVTVGATSLEAAILILVAPYSARGLAPQVAAPAPFGVFHDLRWLLVYHRSWIALVVELVALLIFRSTIDSVLLRAAWPRDLARQSFGASIRRSLGFTAV